MTDLERGLTIHLEDGIAPADLHRIEQGLIAHAAGEGTPLDITPLVLMVRDSKGEALGGLYGRSYGTLKTLFVQDLWLDEGVRGRGLGRALMVRAEQEARARGCVQVYLDTFSFQAPDFYKGMGYEVFGTLPFPGTEVKRYWLRRELA